jgi:hypothetical protein
MSRSRSKSLVALVASMAFLWGIGFVLEEGHGGCPQPAGGRCSGPEAVNELTVSADGRTLGEVLNCGGRLTAHENGRRVAVRLMRYAVGAGAGSCPVVAVTVTLRAPVDRRTVVDATSHASVTLTRGDPYSVS